MPTGEHESTIELVEQNPEILVWLLANLHGVQVPRIHHARRRPVEARTRTYRADGMTLFYDKDDRLLLGIVLEVQRRWDPGKRWTWKVYVAHLETEEQVNAALVVYCTSPRVARRYRRLFKTEGLSLHLRPFIYTAADVPLVVDVERARAEPALALLSAICHGRNPGVVTAFPALVEALEALGPEKGPRYNQILLSGLSEALQRSWGAFMTSATDRRYIDEFSHQIDIRARAEARVDGLLTILEVRGVSVPVEVVERIRGCTDLDQLDIWFRRGITATAIADVVA